MKCVFIILTAILRVQVIGADDKGWAFVANPLLFAHPCKDNDKVILSYESGRPPDEENQYHVSINEPLPKYTRVYIKFDTEATVQLSDKKIARIEANGDNRFFINLFNSTSERLGFTVKGLRSGTIPYITSLTVNNVQYCEKPDVGILDQYIEGYKDVAESALTVPDESCGRRKVTHTELITNGLETKSGDWPWHVAIYKLEKQTIKYICGGTLLTKTLVLTAAHCATIRGVPILPEILSVVLGKYNLIGGDVATQEREVFQIIVHEDFSSRNLNNDIALLKLKSEAVYDDYVQPVCIWYSDAYKKLPSATVHGTVVGWGFDQTNSLSPQLKQATMPKISDSNCIKSNPVFFGRMLNDNKFCAGHRNGTSACNGDSGGGFVVFVPDISGDASNNATGAYYIRGVVSVGVSRKDVAICDPNEYVLMTDVAKYKKWLKQHLQ